jgi:hypothetical protein
MWNTEDGERILGGAEARAFLHGLEYAVAAIEGAIEEGVPERFGVGMFDDLTGKQKLVVLSEAAEALLRAEVPPPRLTALNEGAIAAVFVALSDMVSDLQLAGEMGALDAIAEAAAQDDDTETVEPDDSGMPDWKALIDELSTRVLFDDDWQYVPDSAPARSRQVCSQLGIAEEYFLVDVAEPSRKELRQARSVIDALCAHRRA